MTNPGTPRSGRWGRNDDKFYLIDLKSVEGGKEVRFRAPPSNWSDTMRYDPGLKAVLLNNSSTHKLWTLKFDRKTVKVTETTEKRGKDRK